MALAKHQVFFFGRYFHILWVLQSMMFVSPGNGSNRRQIERGFAKALTLLIIGEPRAVFFIDLNHFWSLGKTRLENLSRLSGKTGYKKPYRVFHNSYGGRVGRGRVSCGMVWDMWQQDAWSDELL